MGRGRTSWIRWYWSHLDARTKLFSCRELGQYLRLQHLQLDSGSEQAIPRDSKVLTRLLGEKPSKKAMAMFSPVGDETLRDEELAEEFWKAKREYDAKSAGGKKGREAQDSQQDSPQVSPEDSPQDSPKDTQEHSTRDASGNLNKSLIPNRDVEPEQREKRPTSTDLVASGDVCPTCGDTDPACKDCRPKPRGGWVGRACDLWTEVKGGIVAPGRMGRALKPLVTRVRKRNGCASDEEAFGKMEPYLRAYLETTEDAYASPEAFAKAPRQGTSAGSVKAKAREDGLRAMIEGGLRDG